MTTPMPGPSSDSMQSAAQPVAKLPSRGVEHEITSENQFCFGCGSALPNGATFCPKCGKAQRGVSSMPSPARTSETGNAAYAALPTPASPAASTTYGALIGDYPGSAFRFVWVVLWGGLSIFGVIASFVPFSFAGLLFWLASAAGCYAYYYYYVRYDVHAQVFERGFVISRGGKTTSARWEDIANVEHRVTTWRLYFIIPLSKSHTYTIRLNNGERVKVGASFQHERQLGDTVQRMWAQAAVAARNSGNYS